LALWISTRRGPSIDGSHPGRDLLSTIALRGTYLRDSSRAQFVMVTRSAALPRAESVRLEKALRRLGIAIGFAIVNAAGAGTCRRCQAVRREESRQMTALLKQLRRQQPYAIIEAPAEMPPPHGVGPLVRWAASWRRIN
jgi:arsenite/tail-anchored protein-transporting ATPase